MKDYFIVDSEKKHYLEITKAKFRLNFFQYNIKMGKIVINEDRCKGCELCIEACPYGLIKMSVEVNHFGYHTAQFVNGKQCTTCKFCGMICPDFAIDVYR